MCDARPCFSVFDSDDLSGSEDGVSDDVPVVLFGGWLVLLVTLVFLTYVCQRALCKTFSCPSGPAAGTDTTVAAPPAAPSSSAVCTLPQ